MSPKAAIPQLNRIRFFDGQRLAANDLSAWQRRIQELRRLHSRAFHSWGIALDLGVRAEAGDTAVEIEPGFAVDCLGREIILSDHRTLAIPAVAASPSGGEAVYFLTASFLEDSDQRVVERRPGVCRPEGTVRLSEEPLLEWRRADQIRPGIDIVLAQAWIRNCQLSRPLSLAVRRSARGSEQPYLAAGQTAHGDTAWLLWQQGDQTLGWMVEVDTSAARFRSVPRYVAHLAGERAFGSSDADGAVLPSVSSMIVPFSAVTNAGREGFRFEVLLPSFHSSFINPPILRQTTGPDLANELGLQVVWMAYVE